jgi:NAD(P)H-dependent FMN reductase
MTLKLHTIIASTRPNRMGPKVATWFHDHAVAHGKFDASLVDLAEFNLPVFDEPKHPRLGQYEHEHTKRWSASVKAADAIVFVSPEYNYGPPPSLINALTYLASEWNYKPLGIVGYGGISGGLRAAQVTRSIVTTLKMMPIPESVPVPNFAQFIGEDGMFTPNDPMKQGATLMLDELHKWAGALKPLRG